MCRRKRTYYLDKLRKELARAYAANKDVAKVNSMLNEVSQHLKNQLSFENNQEILGLINVFREIVIKIQTGINSKTSDNCKCNKVIFKQSMKFYNEHWVNRHNAFHNEKEQKKRLSQWHVNLFDEMKNGEYNETKYEERTELDLDRSDNNTIKA